MQDIRDFEALALKKKQKGMHPMFETGCPSIDHIIAKLQKLICLIETH